MKACFFLGRIHHAYKLLPVAAAFSEAGHEIDILVADNSINIDPATEYLQTFNIKDFHHARDYVDSYDTVDTIAQDTMSFSAGQLATIVPPFWIASSLREAATDYVGFGNYLDYVKPAVVFALHEQNFFVKILFYQAKRRDITTCSLMEGIILEREEDALSKYSLATDYTDTLFSWSEYDRQFYADKDKITPVGATHLDVWIYNKQDPKLWADLTAHHRKRLSIGISDTVITFAPPRLDLYRGDFMKACTTLATWTRDRGIKLIVKLHPFQSKTSAAQLSGFLSKYFNVIVTNDSNAIPYIAIANAVITQTSTVSLESIALGIPLIELDLDYYGLEQPLYKHGAATLIEGNTVDKLASVLNGNGDDAGIMDFKEERLGLLDGNSSHRILNFSTARLWVK